MMLLSNAASEFLDNDIMTYGNQDNLDEVHFCIIIHSVNNNKKKEIGCWPDRYTWLCTCVELVQI